jgi:choline dehydrogenase-like flavoprotein
VGVYHYVVGGGGTAGYVLAARLSEDPAARVLLEAGPADGPAAMAVRSADTDATVLAVAGKAAALITERAPAGEMSGRGNRSRPPDGPTGVARSPAAHGGGR